MIGFLMVIVLRNDEMLILQLEPNSLFIFVVIIFIKFDNRT